MAENQNTKRFIDFMLEIGVDCFDIAVCRSQDGPWINRFDIPQAELTRYLPWVRYENAHGADCYIRPAREHDWPTVFLDDLDANSRDRVLSHFGGLSVHTSREGGYQIWIPTAYPLTEAQRGIIQQNMIPEFGADPGSASGEHFGRLPGIKNHKRGGQWVNVRGHKAGQNLDPDLWGGAKTEEPLHTPKISQAQSVHGIGQYGERDTSTSGREWALVCQKLEQRQSPAAVEEWLAKRATRRGKRQPENYARRTVLKARENIGI